MERLHYAMHVSYYSHICGHRRFYILPLNHTSIYLNGHSETSSIAIVPNSWNRRHIAKAPPDVEILGRVSLAPVVACWSSDRCTQLRDESGRSVNQQMPYRQRPQRARQNSRNRLLKPQTPHQSRIPPAILPDGVLRDSEEDEEQEREQRRKPT